MKKVPFYSAILMIIAVFLLKSIYLLSLTTIFPNAGNFDILNKIALVIICVYILLLIFIVRKIHFAMVIFAFSFLAELFNLIFDGKVPLTMLFYFGMHILLFVYLFKNYNKEIRLFFEFPLCVFIMYLVFSFGYWNVNTFYYIAMTAYSLFLCVNLMLSYSINTNVFRGMLLVFIVDTIVVWSMVPPDNENIILLKLIRGICWLPFMAGEFLIADGVIGKDSRTH